MRTVFLAMDNAVRTMCSVVASISNSLMSPKIHSLFEVAMQQLNHVDRSSQILYQKLLRDKQDCGRVWSVAPLQRRGCAREAGRAAGSNSVTMLSIFQGLQDLEKMRTGGDRLRIESSWLS